MKQYSAVNIKNIAFAGHSSSGKTSLIEALLYSAKATDRLGKISEGNTVCDFDPEEIKRKTSVSTSIAFYEHQDFKINLIDTPGLFDFEGGVYEGIRPAESVIITVSGKSGVSVGTEKAYKLAKKQNKAKAFFISKLDVDNSDFYKVLEQLKTNFGPTVCPIIVPHYENEKVSCYINLLTLKAYRYENGVSTEVMMPNTGHRLDGLLSALSEAVAETDDDLMEKFFSGERFTKEELFDGVKKGIKNSQLTPVFCGSSTTLEAIDRLMMEFVYLLPSATEANMELATNSNGDNIEIPCDENGLFKAFVFKTVADPFVGKLSYIKVVSGKLSADISPVNSRTSNTERIGKILFIKGKKQEEVASLVAGDIAAVTKLSETITGDSLCGPKEVVSFNAIDFPKSTMGLAIKVKDKGDEGKIAQGILRLIEEDPTLSYENNTETKQQVIYGLGEQHLDVVTSKLKSKFGVEVSLENPRVPYRETIRKKVKVQGKHKKQSGGHGQYGDVWIEFEPCDDNGLVFAEKIFGGSVPKNYHPAVEKGLQESVKHGVLAGYPVVGIKATLVDGSYHDVDSSEMAFKMAASIAYKDGLPKASPAILEPIGNLKAYVPDSHTGDIIGEVNKRRGRVLGMTPEEDGLQLIQAQVPMSEMGDFTTAIRSITGGRGYFTFSFDSYEQLPQQLEAAVIAQAKQ